MLLFLCPVALHVHTYTQTYVHTFGLQSMLLINSFVCANLSVSAFCLCSKRMGFNFVKLFLNAESGLFFLEKKNNELTLIRTVRRGNLKNI